MSDQQPPAWLDEAPPSSPPAGRPSGGKVQPTATANDGADFFAWLGSAQTRVDLQRVLPTYLTVESFINTARDAALANPKLLALNIRPSLLRAIGKAAKIGLKPDGREGALVPRYDAETRSFGIVWQPMVWGIIKLGRMTGSIESIRPVIVFLGEDFDIEEGDVQTYRHKVNREIVADAYKSLYGGMSGGERPKMQVNTEDFFSRVDCCYCIVRAKDGTVTKRWMPAERLALIRNAQGKNTPWYGPFLDEMICKTIMLYTAKHIDLDVSNPATEHFREAMMVDMDQDFERDDRMIARGPGNVGLLGHETKLDSFEKLFEPPPEREKVVVGDNIGPGAGSVSTVQHGGEGQPVAVGKTDAPTNQQPDATDEHKQKRTAASWAYQTRLAILELADMAAWNAFVIAQPFAADLERMRGTNLRIANEIEDALETRRTELEAKP